MTPTIMSASASSSSFLPARLYLLAKKRAIDIDCAIVFPSTSKTGTCPNFKAKT